MSERETNERRVPRPPFGAPHVWVVAVIDGEDSRVAHRLGRPETVIGRDGDADFAIDDGEVSKQHCVLRAEGPVCTVTDLGSLNGTLLNGRPLRNGVAQRLRHLDELQVGNTRLFLLGGKFRQSPRR